MATQKSSGLIRITAAYLIALGVAAATLATLPDHLDSLYRGLAMDLAATMVVFVFSVLWRNSSVYDAYWSVAPIALVGYWASVGGGNPDRIVLVAILVSWWGVRLTYSWARGWTGFDHEDWRYVDLRNKTGKAWGLTNLLGIHYFPTMQVFLGMLPVHAALTMDAPVGGWDALAAGVTALAILIEQVSDRQLHDFRQSKPAKGTVLNTGLWKYSRHPNYVGEALFWIGLTFFIFAVEAEIWRISGAVAIFVMFVFISVPMIEKRSKERRPNYEANAARGVFFPMPPRR